MSPQYLKGFNGGSVLAGLVWLGREFQREGAATEKLDRCVSMEVVMS